MPKAHLVVTEFPLSPGSLVISICGETIYPAQICFLWDTVAMNSRLPLSTLMVCKKCWMEMPPDCVERRFIYGVIRQQQPERELGAQAELQVA
jgi:hypothetical protein